MRAARNVFIVIASYIGWSTASGGARWSMPHMPVKPTASATSRALDQRVDRHAHLGKEQMELDAHLGTALSSWTQRNRRRATTTAASGPGP